MKKFEKSLRISAPVDKVFTAASDVNKLGKWMPAKLHDELIARNTGERFDIAEFAKPDRASKRLTWDDGAGYRGSLQVKNAGQGSEVTIAVSSEKPAVTQAEVEAFLTQALASLQKQVIPATGGQR